MKKRQEEININKILIASPVRQTPEILREFLLSLEALDTHGIEIAYIFSDDNNNESSSELLKKFGEAHKSCRILKASEIASELTDYDSTHNWNYTTIDRVAKVKNYMITEAVHGDFTHIFFIDSDIILKPEALRHLLSDNLDIVSNIFWTRFSKWDRLYPQVWLMDQSACFNTKDPRTKNKVYKEVQKAEFIEKLKHPGIYKVGGLGACTLISRKVLEAGVNFSGLYNLSFWGEDRAFCIRAVAHNFELFVDTFYPAYHIYRDEYLSGLDSFKKNGFDFSFNPEHLNQREIFKKYAEGIKRGFRLFIWKRFYRDKNSN